MNREWKNARYFNERNRLDPLSLVANSAETAHECS